ncbi:unnamed protein product, partial [Prorocentrum cordatum]
MALALAQAEQQRRLAAEALADSMGICTEAPAAKEGFFELNFDETCFLNVDSIEGITEEEAKELRLIEKELRAVKEQVEVKGSDVQRSASAASAAGAPADGDLQAEAARISEAGAKAAEKAARDGGLGPLAGTAVATMGLVHAWTPQPSSLCQALKGLLLRRLDCSQSWIRLSWQVRRAVLCGRPRHITINLIQCMASGQLYEYGIGFYSFSRTGC